MQEIPDASIHMILCDLPYGTTRCKWDSILPFDSLWKQYKRIIKDDGVIALFADEPFSANLICSNLPMFRYELIWQKEQGTDFLNANRKPLKAHEKIQIFYKKQPTYNKQFTEGKPYRARNGGKKSTECYGKFKMGYFKSLGGGEKSHFRTKVQSGTRTSPHTKACCASGMADKHLYKSGRNGS